MKLVPKFLLKFIFFFLTEKAYVDAVKAHLFELFPAEIEFLHQHLVFMVQVGAEHWRVVRTDRDLQACLP